MSALLELAAACEAATGPDRELDIAIAEAIGIVPASYERAVCHGKPMMYYWSVSDSHAPHIIPDKFTASLDAAVSLMPEGWRVASLFQRNCRLPNWIWKAELWHPEADQNVRGIARNADLAALALCAAALRARASEQAS